MTKKKNPNSTAYTWMLAAERAQVSGIGCNDGHAVCNTFAISCPPSHNKRKKMRNGESLFGWQDAFSYHTGSMHTAYKYMLLCSAAVNMTR